MGPAALAKVLLGSFFIQSAWNYKRMQALGFAAALAPAIREIYGDAPSRARALERHLDFFNTHPYMVSPLLGAVVRTEELAASGRADAALCTEMKRKVMGPYGAIGDMFFWGALRPLASLAGAAAVLAWGAPGVVVFLVFYNAVHLAMRIGGFVAGYRLGPAVIDVVAGLDLPQWSLRLRTAAAGVAGFLVVTAARQWPAAASAQRALPQEVAAGAAAAAIVCVAAVIMRRGFPRRGSLLSVAAALLAVLTPAGAVV